MKRLLHCIALIFVIVFVLASCTAEKGIQSAVINEDGELVLTYTDGSTENLGVIKGEQGIQGEKGDKGDKGDDGLTPTIEISDDGYWVINGKKTDVKATGKDGIYDAENYQIIFNTNSESIIEPQHIKFGEKIKEPNVPTKVGYSFDGWYVNDEKWSFIGYSVTEDITLTAKWTPIEYTITFCNLPSNNNLQDNSFNKTHTQTYTIEDNFELYTPNSPEHNEAIVFSGWYSDKSLTTNVSQISEGTTGNLTLYAKWENNGLDIVVNPEVDMAYYLCRKDISSDNISVYYYVLEFNIQGYYEYITCEFEFSKPDGTIYTSEELLNLGISYGTSGNEFYIIVPCDIKGQLTIKSVTGKSSIIDIPIVQPEL